MYSCYYTTATNNENSGSASNNILISCESDGAHQSSISRKVIELPLNIARALRERAESCYAVDPAHAQYRCSAPLPPEELLERGQRDTVQWQI